MREFINATADTIDEISFTMQAEIQSLRKENEELRAELEDLKAQIQIKTKPSTTIADIKLSEESLDKVEADLTKALQKRFSR